MHILIPAGIFHPEAGGPATYLYHLLPQLQGHTVEVVTFSDDTPTEKYPYPVLRIPRTNILHRNWVYYRAIQSRLPQADLVFVNSLGLTLPRLKKPSILKIVGDRAWERCLNRGWLPQTEDIDDFQTRRYSPLIEWVKRARRQEALAVDHIIVPSAYLKQMVAGWGVPEERITVIYNAFEPPSLPAQPLTRADLGLSEAPLLLVVARLTAWKGVDTLLQALVNLPDVQAVVAGTGSMLAPWQTLAQTLGLSQRVHFLGNVPREKLTHYYRVADYTVLYSGYEGLSHVILESLSLGTPVIASDKGGNPEIIQHGENGWLVPYKSVAALQTALETALAGETPRKIRQSTRLDSAQFSWSVLVEQTLTLLEQVARQ